jgi:hypothetical protein
MSKIEELVNYFDGYGSPYDGLIIALAKMQIPKKSTGLKTKVKALDIESQEVRTYECQPCPSCERWITKIYNFCPHCGQRIEEC